MSTAVYTTTAAIMDRRHGRDANSAGAPLPNLPRRTSSTSRAASRASAFAVSEVDLVSPITTPNHGATASVRAPTAVVVHPPTPPQLQPEEKEKEEKKIENDGNASDTSSSSDGSQITVASTRPNRIRAQNGPTLASPTPSAPAKLSAPEAGSVVPVSAPIKLVDIGSRPRLRHQHTQSLISTPTFAHTVPRSVSDTPIAAIVRTKSGLPLKSSLKARPALTRGDLSVFIPNATSKSEPATPKAVHFDSQLERVKLFIAQQKPSAVSRDGSPTDDTSGTDSDWPAFIFGPPSQTSDADRARKSITMNVANLPDPAQRTHEDIVLEELLLANDASTINGRVRVRNLAFEKLVIARFTFDDWQTTSEVATKYLDSIQGGVFDRFTFTIRLNDLLARIDEKTLFLALRYTVAGREIWDNNRGANYRATFARKPSPAPVFATSPQQRSALPRSMRRRTIATPLSDEDVADLHGKLEEVARSNSGGESPGGPGGDVSPTPLGGRSGRSTTPDRFSFRSDPLASRYDFAASARQPWRPVDPGSHVRADTHPPAQQAGVPWPSTTVARPAYTRKALTDAFSSSTLGRGSPRAVDEDMLVSPTRYTGYDDDTDQPFRVPARRNHQRGYFDLQPSSFTVGPSFNLRRTPPGTPRASAPTTFTRYNSFPQTTEEETRSPSASVVGTPVPVQQQREGDVVCPVPNKAAGLLRPGWNAKLVIPGGVAAGSEDSTPSITSGESSLSNSPTPSPSEVVGELLARPVSERLASPVDESYSAFLNRFCFFTGSGTAQTPPEMQRSHSASSVEEFLSTPPTRSFSQNLLPPFDTPSRPSSADSMRTTTSVATLRQ